MKETIFRNLTFSLILTNIWSIWAFFIYFLDNSTLFSGFGVWIFYIESSWILAGSGTILVLLRLFYFKKDKKNKFVFNFIYSCIGTFNLLLFLIFLILICFGIIKGGFFEMFFFANPVIATFIFIDIIKTIKQKNG
jgi:membrane protease YdiL (CAAX protease family)